MTERVSQSVSQVAGTDCLPYLHGYQKRYGLMIDPCSRDSDIVITTPLAAIHPSGSSMGLALAGEWYWPGFPTCPGLDMVV